jgi:hypothetical protein
MEPLSFLANLLLTVTIGTLMVALMAYMAYKIRETRRPCHSFIDSKLNTDSEMIFLRPYVLQSASSEQKVSSDTSAQT